METLRQYNKILLNHKEEWTRASSSEVDKPRAYTE